MKYVIKLLKGRKAAAKLELSHCKEENEDYDKVREKLTEEIEQLEESLLIFSHYNHLPFLETRPAKTNKR